MKWNEKIGAAATKLALRIAVAGYLTYLAWKILGGTLDETSPIFPWVSYAICAVFILVAIGFVFYSVREFLRAINAPANTQKDEKTPEVLTRESESDNDDID